MKNKILFALIVIMAAIIIVLGVYAFAKQDNAQSIKQQYAYQVNIHQNIDGSNPIKENIYIPDKTAKVIMKLITERYQMYGTVSYVDDIYKGNHDHIMFNEITKWNYPKNLSIEINGKKIKTFSEEKINVEMTLSQYFKPGRNEIIFYSECDGRVNASIFVQVE